MNNIYCDQCYKYIDVTLKDKTHPRGIEETYFKCNHCYHHYTVAVTGKRARKIQRNMKRKGIVYTRDNPSDEQKELDGITSTLKSNLINYGVADL